MCNISDLLDFKLNEFFQHRLSQTSDFFGFAWI